MKVQLDTEGWKIEELTLTREMSGRICHNIRNPLAVISLNVELVKAAIKAGNLEKALNLLSACDAAVARIANYTNAIADLGMEKVDERKST